MNLEFNHVSPYLPYNLKVLRPDGKTILPVIGLEISGKSFIFQFQEETGHCSYGGPEKTKPILHPLSGLTKEIEYNGEKFVPMKWLVSPDGKDWDKMTAQECTKMHLINGFEIKHGELGEILFINRKNPGQLPYNLWRFLVEWQFDVFGLIESGLAVDINTLPK